MQTHRHPCPCCTYLTLRVQPPGTRAVCPVCFWEDDVAQYLDPTREEGANAVSLEMARANFRAFGAAEAHLRIEVRSPRPAEHPAQ